jgi:hypothetical protein
MTLKLTQLLNEYAQKVVNDLIKKYKVENPNLTDDDIETIKKDYINRFEELKDSPKVVEKDITQYSFQQLKKLVDSFPPKKEKSSNNNVEFSQTELIYNKPPLQIYHGSNEKTCIKIKGDFPSSWCVSRSIGGNMYNTYRYAGTEPSFYFVKNIDRLNRITEIEDDLYCFFVIQFNNQGKYIVTNAKNDGDREMSWNDILKIEPLLQGTESLFKNVPLTDEEREYYRRFGNGIEDEEYKDLSYKEKKIYISITRELSDEKFKITPNDLINDYISMGVELTDEQFDFIKDTRQLFNNYRRVTIDNVIPEYLKGRINFGARWLVLTDDEAVDLYNKSRKFLADLLVYKPQLIDYFEHRLHQIDMNDLYYLIFNQPQLVEYFEDRLKKIDEYSISSILEKHPQLKPYFEKQGLLKESLKYPPLRNILKR